VTSARFDPSGPLRGSLMPPPDKSISHRAALVAAMSSGETEVSGYLDADDTRASLEAIKAVGAEVTTTSAGTVVDLSTTTVDNSSTNDRLDLVIRGGGLYCPSDASGPDPIRLDVGNAGTLLRILPGWLAGQRQGSWTLDGDESIRKRPFTPPTITSVLPPPRSSPA